MPEPPFIVSGGEFRASLFTEAEKAGLRLVEQRFFFVNRVAMLRRVSS